MRRDDLLVAIASSLASDYIVAPDPDHPDLLVGPDLLAGRAGDLLAVFVPRPVEYARPERLLGRLALSRLALPDHLRSVAVYPAGGAARGFDPSALAPHVQAVVGWSGSEPIGEALRPRGDFPTYPIPDLVRRIVFERSAYLYSLTLTHHHRAPRPFPAGGPGGAGLDGAGQAHGAPDAGTRDAFSADLVEKLAAAGARVRLVGRVAVVDATVSPARDLETLLEPLVAVSTLAEFSLDAGVPYLHEPLAGLLVGRDLRASSADPTKPFRAAAFAGWAIVDADEPGVDRVAAVISSWLESLRLE
jgi:hypothetical protein